MNKQNVTLSIRKDILQKVKIMAAKQNTSISALMTGVLEEVVALDEGYQVASQNYRRLLEKEIDLGTKGSIGWSRDELHDR